MTEQCPLAPQADLNLRFGKFLACAEPSKKLTVEEHVMAFKVQVGPPQVSFHQGQTVLVTDPDGTITWPSEKGLYFLDTRIISNWAIYANGEPWQLLNGGPISYDAARIFLTNKS